MEADAIIHSTDVSLSELQETVEDSGAQALRSAYAVGR